MTQRPRLSGVDLEILDAVSDGPIDGVARLAALVRNPDNLHYVRSRLRLLTKAGLVVIEYPSILGGRGMRAVIRRGYHIEASES